MHLGVMLTDDRGLWDWQRVGTLQRELALYQQLGQRGVQISLFTHDRRPGLPALPLDAAVHRPWPLFPLRVLGPVHRLLLPRRLARAGRQLDLLMTNQAHGASAAVAASRHWGVPLVARCGYVLGERAEVLGGGDRGTRARIHSEGETLRAAAACVVPTARLADWVIAHHGVNAQRVQVIPNYVRTELFAPDPAAAPRFDVTVVARLESAKRHRLILGALAGTDLSAHFIGDGSLRHSLERLARRLRVRLQISPRVEHTELPAWLNASRVVVQASAWEGHPKAVLEAMACGRPCVVCDAPGLGELVEDGLTGRVVAPRVEALREAIVELIDQPELASGLGQRAGDAWRDQVSLESVAPRYLELFGVLLR